MGLKTKLFTDGGARGNPGPAAYGYVLEAEDGTVLAAHGEAIGVATNNVAEYSALVAGLRRRSSCGVAELEVVSDSELMVKQMRGEYKVKNEALRELCGRGARLARAARLASRYTAVRREHNKLADRLVERGPRRRASGAAILAAAAEWLSWLSVCLPCRRSRVRVPPSASPEPPLGGVFVFSVDADEGIRRTA